MFNSDGPVAGEISDAQYFEVLKHTTEAAIYLGIAASMLIMYRACKKQPPPELIEQPLLNNDIDIEDKPRPR